MQVNMLIGVVFTIDFDIIGTWRFAARAASDNKEVAYGSTNDHRALCGADAGNTHHQARDGPKGVKANGVE